MSGSVYRNTCSSLTADRGGIVAHHHHWLKVELVGVESNRDGIGARVVAVIGEQRQMREIWGGLGMQQSERIAHFGLARDTRVDELRVSWPSGQVDVLTNIDADQRIRVVEGRGTYYPVLPTVWEHALPDTIIQDQTVSLQAWVRPALFEPTAHIAAVRANLEALGGPDIPLADQGNGTYFLDTVLPINAENGRRELIYSH